MWKLNDVALAGALVFMAAATGLPVMAQQTEPQGPMGQGGMMGQGAGPMGPGMMGPGMMGGCGMMGGMGHGGMRAMMMASAPMTEAKLAYMKADLGITDAQASAWEDYARAVRAQQAAMETLRGDMLKAMGGSALDRMDARIKALETVVDNLKALKPATTALYAVLTDAQKEKADQLLGGACGMM